MEYYNSIIDTIGNTPLVKLNKIVNQIPALVLAKIESFNPWNSIKDRMAWNMITEAEKKWLLPPWWTIIESTSGNTGMWLALQCIARWYKLICTMTDKQSKEKMDILRAMWAEVVVTPTSVASDDPKSYYSVARRLAQEIPNAYYINQYDNLANREAHYSSTWPEIREQTEWKITHMVAGVGTWWTISWTAKYLKEKNPNIKVWWIDTYWSTLKAYHENWKIDNTQIYSYITEWIWKDIIPANIDFNLIDRFEKVSDKDGAIVSRRLAREEWIFAGYSSWSALAWLLQLSSWLNKDSVVVIIFPDHGSRYIGKIFNDDWMKKQGFLD